MDNNSQFQYSKIISIDRNKSLAVRIFPNPVKNELNIDLNFDRKKTAIEVFDVLGRTVFQENTEGGNSLKINILNWTSGIYFLTVTNGQKGCQQKIIKQ